ncbi:MAG: ankyrin repeat protein [Faunusvirus sp.]|jgi:hypothetical protein|uniref:Ankyrin repeat protein n=1 Tax=Faunusvirus sp. TaxID=2487766 RepID=A0A3G4ZWY6_9VIRU|nr:MAG: ankyrin repeat protein [Faunusvirus sp.]
MNYPLEEINSALYFQLAANPEKLYSSFKLYDDIYRENLCPELKTSSNKENCRRKYNIAFATLNIEYNNVHKLYINGKQYLIFSTRKKDELIREHNNYHDTDTKTDTNIDYVEIIRHILDNPSHFETFDVDTYIDGADTPLHVLARCGDITLINSLFATYCVDIHKKNIHGDTALDIAAGRLDFKLTKYLLEEANGIVVDKLKDANHKLKQLNNSLIASNIKYKDQIESTVKVVFKLFCAGMFGYFAGHFVV